MLGGVRENEGIAARILLDFNADAETIRNEIIRMLSGPKKQKPPAPPPVRRYVIEILIGPCDEQRAVNLMVSLSDVIGNGGGALGAALSLKTWVEGEAG